MKESKGLPLQTTASGSGASVGAVMGTVVGSVWGGSVVVGTSCGGGTVCEMCVISITGVFLDIISISSVGLVISSVVSGCFCGLRLKSEMGCCVGFSWRLMPPVGIDGVVSSNSSSSSSANTKVSPRAEGEKSDISDYLSPAPNKILNTQAGRFSYSS